MRRAFALPANRAKSSGEHSPAGLRMGICASFKNRDFMFGLAVLFQIITLPVEFNASARALRILTDSGMLMEEETRQASTGFTGSSPDLCGGGNRFCSSAFPPADTFWRT